MHLTGLHPRPSLLLPSQRVPLCLDSLTAVSTCLLFSASLHPSTPLFENTCSLHTFPQTRGRVQAPAPAAASIDQKPTQRPPAPATNKGQVSVGVPRPPCISYSQGPFVLTVLGSLLSVYLIPISPPPAGLTLNSWVSPHSPSHIFDSPPAGTVTGTDRHPFDPPYLPPPNPSPAHSPPKIHPPFLSSLLVERETGVDDRDFFLTSRVYQSLRFLGATPSNSYSEPDCTPLPCVSRPRYLYEHVLCSRAVLWCISSPSLSVRPALLRTAGSKHPHSRPASPYACNTPPFILCRVAWTLLCSTSISPLPSRVPSRRPRSRSRLRRLQSRHPLDIRFRGRGM